MNIESLRNSKIKLARSLGRSKERRLRNKFVVEGFHLVFEVLDSWVLKKKFPIDFILCTQNAKAKKEGKALLAKADSARIECFEISEKVSSELSGVETPQGVLAVVSGESFELKDLLKKPDALIVFCADIQDPGNLGTMIRTADAVGASGLIVSKGSVDVYNDKVIRASMGSIFHLPIVFTDNIEKTISELKKQGLWIVATSSHAKKDHFDEDLKKPAVILVGNEAQGLPKQIENLANAVVKLPMPGKAESLNAAVSTAVVLYEAYRQRRNV